MPDIRPELIERVRDELAGYLIGGGDYPVPIALDEADELAQVALEAVADDLRAEGAAKALREAAEAVRIYAYQPSDVREVNASASVAYTLGANDAHAVMDRLLRTRTDALEAGQS